MRHPITPFVLLYLLAGLMVADIVTTFVGVGIMGATELSPICDMVGFQLFIVIKVIVSAACVYVIHKYSIPAAPAASTYFIAFLIAFYAVVCALNLCQIAGQVL